MTIEEIRTFLQTMELPEDAVSDVIYSIVAIRSEAYGQGWDDAIAEQ